MVSIKSSAFHSGKAPGDALRKNASGYDCLIEEQQGTSPPLPLCFRMWPYLHQSENRGTWLSHYPPPPSFLTGSILMQGKLVHMNFAKSHGFCQAPNRLEISHHHHHHHHHPVSPIPTRHPMQPDICWLTIKGTARASQQSRQSLRFPGLSSMLPVQVALKVADVGHLCAPLPIHKRWTARLTEEFFCQGDREYPEHTIFNAACML